jgi:MFS family permease
VEKINKKKFIKKVLQWGIYFVVAVFVVLTLKDHVEEIKNYDLTKLWPAIFAIPIAALVVVVESFAWDRMMKYAGEKVSTIDSLNVYISSYIVRYVPGNVWAILARAAMNAQHGVKYVKTMWGWLIENVSFLLVGLIVSLFVFSGVWNEQPELFVIVVIGLVVCGGFVLRYEWLGIVFEKVVRKRLPEKYQDQTETLVLTIKQRVSLMGFHGVAWFLFGLFHFVIIYIVAGVGLGDLVTIIGIAALSWSIGYMSLITPSGSGVREGVMILALTTLGLTGEVDAIVVALLARFVYIVGELSYFGLIKLVKYFIKSDEK